MTGTNVNNMSTVTPLSYGGITYSISQDGDYIISSDNIKYYIHDNKVTLPIDTLDRDD
jgi:hypothetical protein